MSLFGCEHEGAETPELIFGALMRFSPGFDAIGIGASELGTPPQSVARVDEAERHGKVSEQASTRVCAGA